MVGQYQHKVRVICSKKIWDATRAILSWHWRTCRAACPQQEDDVKVGRLGENEYQRIQLLCYSPTPPDTVHCKSMIMKLVNSVLINMNEVVDDLPMAMVLVSCLCLVP